MRWWPQLPQKRSSGSMAAPQDTQNRFRTAGAAATGAYVPAASTGLPLTVSPEGVADGGM